MIPVLEAFTVETDNELREDEYRNDMGLICCKNCHSLRQITLAVGDKQISPRVLCRCQEEERDRMEAEWKARRQREEIERNRSIGLTDPVIGKHTFENDLGYNPHAMEIARNYVEHWEEFTQNSQGLLLWGDVGTGKSFLADCIGNELLNRGIRVQMTNFSRLLNRLTDLQMGNRNGFIDSLNTFDLLILDDLGIERNSEFAKEQTFSIIDSRYRSGLPMIVTTNLSLLELRNPGDLWRKRIFDRVLERCIPVCVNDQNIRKILSEKAMERGKELFTHGKE